VNILTVDQFLYKYIQFASSTLKDPVQTIVMSQSVMEVVSQAHIEQEDDGGGKDLPRDEGRSLELSDINDKGSVEERKGVDFFVRGIGEGDSHRFDQSD
jgi:hypothetical protein